jgi:GAF domain-containing protein
LWILLSLKLTADLGQFALEDADLQDLRQQVVERVAETLNVELTKIQEFTADGQQLLLTAGVGWRTGFGGEQSGAH